MADLFTSDIGQAQGVQVNAPGGGLAMPTSLGGVIGNDYEAQQAKINDLTTTNLAKNKEIQMQRNADMQTALLKQQEANNKLLQEQSLQKLATNLQSGYNKVDTTVTNPVEANLKKQQIKTSALVAAGKDGYSYINSVADSLSTKQEVRPDGMINILDPTGNIVGVRGYDKEQIMAHKTDNNVNAIHEVFPNTVDTMDALFQLDQQKGGTLSNSSMNETVLRLKNSANNFKHIADDYHMQSQYVSADQSKKLADTAQQGYISNINSMFNTFMNPEVINSIKSGTLDRSHITLAMQQVRRDITDEITTQHVPVNIGDIDKYIKTTMDDINTAYTDVQANDKISIEQAGKTIEAKNALKTAMLKQQMDTPTLEALTPYVDFVSKTAATAANISQAADALQYSTQPGAAVQAQALFKQAGGLLDLNEGVQPKLQQVSNVLYQSQFDFKNFNDSLKTIKTARDFNNSLHQLAKVTDHPAGWVMQPYVQASVENALPKYQQLVKDGVISQQQLDDVTSQLGQYNDYSKSLITKTGSTEEQHKSSLFNVTGLMGWATDLFSIKNRNNTNEVAPK